MQFYIESPLAARCWVTSLLRACERVRGSEGADLRGRPWWGRRTGGRGQGQEMTAALWPPSGRLGTGSTFGRCRQLHSTGGHPTAAAPATKATGQGTGHRERPPNACGIARAPSATGARPVLGVERSQLPSERRARAAFNPAAAVAPASSQAVARTPAGHRPPGKRPGRPWACGSSGSPTLARLGHAGGGRGSARTASLPRCQPRPVQRKLITQVKF